MMDGEASERVWAVLNVLGAFTCKITAGHHHDVINNHHSDMNMKRVHSMGESPCFEHWMLYLNKYSMQPCRKTQKSS